MSADANTMQALLAQRLMQSPQSPSYGGGAAGPQMQGQVSPLNAASQAVQQAMLIRALQRPQQPPQQQPSPQAPPPAVNPLTMMPNGPQPGVTTNFDQSPGATTFFGN